MPYEIVENFAAGLDTRKNPIVAPGGTLTILKNAVISPGGEITKRRAFVKTATLTGSIGLAATSAKLYIFGRDVVPPAPTLTADGVTLSAEAPIWRLKIPAPGATFQQTDFDIFDGKVYIAGVYNGANSHFYDDTGLNLATMVGTEGTGKGSFIRTYQAKMYSVNGRYLYFSAINTPQVWNTATDISPVAVTNLSVGFPARVSVASGDIGKFKNGRFVVFSGADASHAKANGFHRISSVNSPANTFLLDEVDTTTATAAQTTGMSVDTAPTTGAGYINLATQDSGGEIMTTLEVYYSKLALFSAESTQMWTVNPDPLLNQYEQLLRGSGTSAPLSSLQYGSGDVLYLDASGIRSLKAKDSSNSASVSDIGSPVDPTIRTMLLDPAKGQAYLDKAIAILEPSIGRFWMIFPREILVLSNFPGPNITAWSVLTLPFTVTYAVTCKGRIYLRDDADNLYVYGGASGQVYDNCGVEVRLPYLSGKKPGHNKQFQAIDLTLTGTWEVRVSYDFNNPESEEVVGTFSQSTWGGGLSELTGNTSHISLRFYNTDANDATLSNVGVHYSIADDEA